MVIHAIFMTEMEPSGNDEATALREYRCRCVDSAEETIDLMYSTFRADNYFQTWSVPSVENTKKSEYRLNIVAGGTILPTHYMPSASC